MKKETSITRKIRHFLYTLLTAGICWIGRQARLLAIKKGWIKEGGRLWYYYLPTDKFIDEENNKDKPHDIIQRGKKFGIKHKNFDILRRGFYDTKEIAQGFIDMDYKRYKSIKYFSDVRWDACR